MRFFDILKLNNVYLKRNLRTLIKLCRVIIISMTVFIFIINITIAIKRKSTETSHDYLLEHHEAELSLTKSDIIDLQHHYHNIFSIRVIEEELYHGFVSQLGETYQFSVAEESECSYPLTVSVNEDISDEYLLDLGTFLSLDNIYYKINSFHSTLKHNADIIMCQSEIFRTKKQSYIFSFVSEIKNPYFMWQLEKDFELRFGLHQSVKLVDMYSQDISVGLSGFLVKIIRMVSLLIFIASLSSIGAITRVIELERYEEFVILKYFGATHSEIKLILRLFLVLIFIICLVIAILVNVPLSYFLKKL